MRGESAPIPRLHGAFVASSGGQLPVGGRVPYRFRFSALLVAASALCACGGPIDSTPVSQPPTSTTLSGTFTAATLSVQERTRTALTIGSIGAVIYAGTSAAGTPAFTTCSLLTNGTATLTVTAPIGTDTIVLDAASGCSPSAGGAGASTTGTVVAQFQATATVAAGMSTLAQAFGGGSPIGLATATPVPSATPTATPTVAPTATPTPAPVVLTQTTLAFVNVGAGFAQSASISEAGYTGSFTIASSTCSGIATASISGSTITVTPVAAGSCTLSIAGGAGQPATLTIGVTTTSLGGS